MTSEHLRRWLADTGERALASFVQAALVFLLTFPVAWNLTAWQALLAAGLQAAAAVVLATLSTLFPPPTSWLADTIGRTVRTFLGTILAALAAGAIDMFTLDGWQAILAAACTATLATFKAAAVRNSTELGLSPASWATRKDPAR